MTHYVICRILQERVEIEMVVYRIEINFIHVYKAMILGPIILFKKVDVFYSLNLVQSL